MTDKALRNTLQNLFIGLCSLICELCGPKTVRTCSNLVRDSGSQDELEFLSDFGLSNGRV